MNGVQAAIFGGSAMILMVLALRLFLKKHLPRGIFPTLWCAAAVRLLLPITVPTHLSVWNLLHTPAAAQANGVISDVLTPFPSLAASSTAKPAADIAGISPMLLVWLVCAILLAAYFVIGYTCMVRRFRGTRLAPQPSIDALLDRFRFSRDPRICVSNSRRAPLTFGVFRPTVLLPEDLPIGDAQFQLVLAHELAHIRRKDCLRKLLLTVCLCLYWWNPLVWMMVWLANRDMELACDEAVLRALGPDCKKAYALTLLDMAQRNPKSAPLCSGFAKSSAEERIRAILCFKRIPAWVGIFVSVLFVLTASAFTTQAVNPSVLPEMEPAVQEKIPEENVAVSVPVSEPIPTTPPIMPEQETESETQPQPEVPAYIFPLEDANAEVTNPYGWQAHPVTKQKSLHSGVDLAADYGTNVLAVADGTVLDCSYDAAYGYILTLEHENGVQTQYAHLSEFLVNAGAEVRQGQIIAKTGDSGWATGPHLHLGVLIDGEAVDPLEALKSE
ncbi:MAG: M56 family metallopeptidase [Oscillospiraceae bacterium]